MSRLQDLYPFLVDEDIVRLAAQLHETRKKGEWGPARPRVNSIVVHLAPDDQSPKKIEFVEKSSRYRKVIRRR